MAVVAVGSSLAVYAGISKANADGQKTQAESCDMKACCPMGDMEDCYKHGCE